MQNDLPKSVHVVGICGVATSALAIAFHKANIKVTGSDKGFFPPVSTELEKAGVHFYAGWHPEYFTKKENMPEVFIVGTASGSHNPETEFAKEHNIPIYSFAEAIGKYFVRKNSICAVGTWGKTSSSALLSHILDCAKYDPTYMFGGISLSHESSAKLGNSDWSVFEGDEYKSSPTDTSAKFFYYKPSHLLMTAVSWDHADLYPTENSYMDAFRRLIREMPDYGFIVANIENAGVKLVTKEYKRRIISYGKNNKYDFIYSDVSTSKSGIVFKISYKDKKLNNREVNITSPMLGTFQAENITGCFAMAYSLGIDEKTILNAISSFKGMKRRLEKRYEGEITVFDDIAHSPEKASYLLKELRSIYKGNIIVVYEPNSGSRSIEIMHKYKDAFQNADLVIVPRLTKLKIGADSSKIFDGPDLQKEISKSHQNSVYIEEDNQVVERALFEANKKPDSIIVFVGAHGFRGMIEETITYLRRQSQS